MKITANTLLILCCMIPVFLRASADNPLLSADTSIYSEGVAGASSTFINDVSLLSVNPASCSLLKSSQIHGSYQLSPGGSSLFQAIYAQGLSKKPGSGNIGFSFFYFNNIMDLYDGSGESSGKLSFSSGIFSINLGYPLSDRLLTGMNLKYIYESLNTYSATAVALDGGLTWFIRNFAVSFAFHNLGTPVVFMDDKEYLPFQLRGGISASFMQKRFQTALEMISQDGKDQYLNLGFQFHAAPAVLRMGLSNSVSAGNLAWFSGISGGAEVSLNNNMIISASYIYEGIFKDSFMNAGVMQLGVTYNIH